MENVVDQLIKFKRIIILLFVFICMFGVYSFFTIAKKEFPNTAIPIVSIKVVAPGYTANEIETTIQPKINDVIEDVNDVSNVYSYSFANVGVALVEFDLSVTDVTPYLTDISKEINDIDFKDENIKVEVTSDFKESQVVYAITGNDQYAVAEELSKQISQIEGVDATTVAPASSMQVALTVDSNKLAQYHISYSDFIKYISGIGMNVPLGYTSDAGVIYPIITQNNFTSIEDIEQQVIFVDPYTKTPIKIGDVATVSEVSTVDQHYTYNSEKTTFVQVYFQDNLDYTKVGKELTTLIENNQHEGDYKINQLVYQPDDVNHEINSIFINLLESIILVIIIVMMGLGIRSSLLISVTFPFTILSTIAMLNIFGQDLQKISIAGLIISIGIIVDNAIVINDAIVYNLERDMDKKEAINDAVHKNFIPVLTSTATTIAAFCPLLFLSGLAGTIVYSLPVTVIIALVFSFIMAMVLTPLLAFYFINPSKTKIRKNKKPFFNQEKIAKRLKRIIQKPLIVIPSILVIVCAISALGLMLQVTIFPSAEKSVIYVEYTNTKSTSYDDTVVLDQEINEYIHTLDYIESNLEQSSSVVAGQMPQFYSTLPTLPLNSNQGYIYLDMNDDIDVTDLKLQLNKDLNTKFGDVAKISANEVELSVPMAPITMVIKGDDIEQLQTFATDITPYIQGIDGVSEVSATKTNQTKLYKVVPNEAFLMQNNLVPAQVEAELAKVLNDINVPLVKSDKYADDLLFNTEIKTTEDILNGLYVFNGKTYKGSDLFTIEEEDSYESFYSQNFSNAVVLSVYLEPGIGVFGVQKQINEHLKTDGTTPSGIEIEYNGEAEMAKEVFSGVGSAAIVALIAIFIILLLQFNSFKNSFIVLLTVPLSIAGSIMFLVLFNEPLSFSAGIGLTSLLGIVVNNGILLVSYIEDYKLRYDELIDVCTYAVLRRMRPIILSNVTTMIGLTPLIIAGGDFFRPMAIALAGGLFVGTILTIILVPTVYYALNKKQDQRNRLNNK